MKLVLGVNAELSSKGATETHKIIADRKFTCEYCGVHILPPKEEHTQSEEPETVNSVDVVPEGKKNIILPISSTNGYMRVILHGEKKKETVACPLCYYTMSMERLSRHRYIYMPDTSQSKLNFILHYLFSTYKINVESSKDAQRQSGNLFLNFQRFATPLKKISPLLISNPNLLPQLLQWKKLESPQEYKSIIDTYLKGVRILPFPMSSKEEPEYNAVYSYAGEQLYVENFSEVWNEIYMKEAKKYEKHKKAA